LSRDAVETTPRPYPVPVRRGEGEDNVQLGYELKAKTMARVVLDKLSKTFRAPGGALIEAVKDVSLTVGDGEFVVIVGPSGCGKTTTLRLIAGFEELDKGTISIDGQTMKGIRPKDRDVAMVFQQHALYPHMSAYENMALGLKLRGCPKTEADKRVRETAELLGLAANLEQTPETLSGGERQRVALGRAIVRKPKVFLFDEPLSNLDGPLRLQMRAELARLHRRLSATMLYVTHDQAEAMILADRIAVMRAGALEQVAAPDEIYERPANMFVAGFFGTPPMNFFPGIFEERAAGIGFESDADNSNAPISFQLEGKAEEQARKHVGKGIVLGLRPEHIQIVSGMADPDTNSVQATVDVVERFGPETWVHLRRGGVSFIVRSVQQSVPKVGEVVGARCDLEVGHFFEKGTEGRVW